MKTRVKLIARELCDGGPVGGLNIIWEKGSAMVVTQEWEHRCSGPVWSEMEAHHIEGGDIFPFLAEWTDTYTVTEIEEIS